MRGKGAGDFAGGLRDVRKVVTDFCSDLRDAGKGTPDFGSDLRDVGKGTPDFGSDFRDAGKGTPDFGSGLRDVDRREGKVSWSGSGELFWVSVIFEVFRKVRKKLSQSLGFLACHAGAKPSQFG